MYSAADQYISICWERVFGRSSPRNSVPVSEIFSFIRELGEFVGTPELFTRNELELLRKMSQRRPGLQLKKSEAQKFLLQLVGAKSMDLFLKERARLTVTSLRRLVENYPKNVDLRDHIAKNDIDLAPKMEDDSRDDTWLGKWWRSDQLAKFAQREDTTKFRDLFTSLRDAFPRKETKNEQNEPKNDKIYENFAPKLRAESEFSRYGVKPEKSTYETRQPTRHIFSGSFEHQKIKELEEMCTKYERELDNARITRDQSRSVENLRNLLREQDNVIQNLKMRARYGETHQNPLESLPIIKQIGRLQQGTSGLKLELVVDIVTVVFTVIILLNLLKLVYYVLLTITTRKSDSIYDFSDEEPISFSWIQQIPWLEYKLYQVQDWWDS